MPRSSRRCAASSPSYRGAMTASLIYFNTASLDGYIADPKGEFGWAEPDHEVHAFVNDLVRPSRTHLYGRKVYEVMTFWEDPDLDEMPEVEREFALEWQAVDKIVYSRTLTEVSTKRTELRREFDPAEVRRMKDASDHPLMIGGGELASTAARAGELDEVHLIVATAVVGGGTRFLDEGLQLDLALLDQRRFANGFVYVAYRVVG